MEQSQKNSRFNPQEQPEFKQLLLRAPLSKKIDPKYDMTEGEIEILKEYDMWKYYTEHKALKGGSEEHEFAQKILKHYAVSTNLALNSFAYIEIEKVPAFNPEPPSKLVASAALIEGAFPEDEKSFRQSCIELRDLGVSLLDHIGHQLAERSSFGKATMEEVSHIPEGKNDLNKTFNLADSAKVSFFKENAKGYSDDMLASKLDIVVYIETIDYIKNDFNNSDCVKGISERTYHRKTPFKYIKGFLDPIEYPKVTSTHPKIDNNGNFLYDENRQEEGLSYPELLELQHKNYWSTLYSAEIQQKMLDSLELQQQQQYISDNYHTTNEDL